MKQGIHPDYRSVVFRDASNGQAFLGKSTMDSDKTIKWEDGNEYPLITLEISSTSHPFYTGTQRLLDTAGRVERFEQRYGLKKSAKAGGSAPEDAPAAEAEAAEAAEADTPEAEAPEAEAKDSARDGAGEEE